MQLIGKDKVKCAYHEGTGELVELQSGAFQLGYGPSATLITTLEQVAVFPSHVQAKVESWLKGSGVQQAKQERVAAQLHELAMAAPGALDQLSHAAESRIPGVTAKINAFLTSLLVEEGLIPSRPLGLSPDTPEADLRDLQPKDIARYGQIPSILGERGRVKEFVPPEALFEQDEVPGTTVIPRSATQERLKAEQDDAKAAEGAGELVGAGVGAEADAPAPKRPTHRFQKKVR